MYNIFRIKDLKTMLKIIKNPNLLAVLKLYFKFNTIKFRNKDHSNLRQPSLLRPLKIKTALTIRPLVSVPKYISMKMGPIETCSLVRPLATGAIGGLNIRTSL